MILNQIAFSAPLVALKCFTRIVDQQHLSLFVNLAIDW